MITTEEEFIFTRERAAEFAARLDRLQAHPQEGTIHRAREAAARNQVETLTREIALWEAGIREPVPDSPVEPIPGTTEEDYQALPPSERAAWSRRLATAVKRAEIANIDRQIGIALDRIANWRRHRSWLEREISDPAEADREPAGSRV